MLDVDHGEVSWLVVLLRCAFAARDLGRQRIQMRSPVTPETLQPLVDLTQGCGVDAVQPTRALGPHVGEAVVAQHLQMLRNRRLADLELGADHLGDGT